MVLLAFFALTTALGYALWQRDDQLTRRYHASLAVALKSTWSRIETSTLKDLKDAAVGALKDPGWNRSWTSAHRASNLGSQLDSLIGQHPTWRADVFDVRGKLLYSTAGDVDLEPLFDSTKISRARDDATSHIAMSGLVHVARDRYYWVYVVEFSSGVESGALALGVPADTVLPDLAVILGGEVSIVNLRGRPVTGTGSKALFSAPKDSLNARIERAWDFVAGDGRTWLGVSLPLLNQDHRPMGAVIALRDVTQSVLEDWRFTVGLASGGGILIVSILVLIHIYLRYATEPLGRALEVLGALAKGDVERSLEDGDELQTDEAGLIARGVASLRQEVLNLQMLRDELSRNRAQQERLIREQLKTLAESLDPESRGEILHALDADDGSEGKGRENHLADLAEILSRLSGLITDQQVRLLALLGDLRAAMEDQALLVSLQQELDIARRMQLSILPRNVPLPPEVEISALMFPARDVGGDFYDYFLVDQDHLAIVVADVSGKGVPAAFFMAISRTLLKSNVLFLGDPSKVMVRLNAQLCGENEQMMFVTMFFGLLDLKTGELVYVNAGHNPPVCVPLDGRAWYLPSGQNTALAVADDIDYREGRLKLNAGDGLFLYTDGVTEAVNEAGELFGTQRLLESLAIGSGSVIESASGVLNRVREFERGCPQADDITCVAIRYCGRS